MRSRTPSRSRWARFAAGSIGAGASFEGWWPLSEHRIDEHLGDAVSALVDGELDAGERAAAEAHLAQCATCRDERDATTAMARALQSLPPVEPPAVALARFRPRADRRRRPVLAGLAVAGMVALAVGVGGQMPAAAVSPPVEEMLDRHQDRAVPAHGFT